MPAPSVGGDASNPAAQAVTTAPRLTVQVALDPKLKDQLDPNATLFVFARAASGPPMPLAIQRLKAGQLPITVTLDDSMSMMPAMTLSKFPQVVVGARVSKSGNAMAQSGDLQVLSASIDVRRAEPVALSIDQVVP
jgi:cytochrome c-type biogenesis protein CcmH